MTRPGRVNCWFSHCFEGLSLGFLAYLWVLWFFSLHKNQQLEISIRIEDPEAKSTGFSYGNTYFVVTVMLVKSGDAISASPRRIYNLISCVVFALTLALVTVLSPLVLESKTS